MGIFEYKLMPNLFSKRSLWQIIVLKSLIYVSAFLLVSFIISSLFNIIFYNTNIFSLDTYYKAFEYISTPFHVATSLFYCLLFVSTIAFIQISKIFGPGILIRFLGGTYKSPKVEQRAFMFLDLSDSTMMAEKMGHIRFFQFIQDTIADISQPITNNQGEIYKYMGDEVIISWKMDILKNKNMPIDCFFAIQNKLEERSMFYQKSYGYLPFFKAGLHVGESVVGEIGVEKKEIAYSGDLLNTTARIQAKCKELKYNLLISADYITFLGSAANVWNIIEIGSVPLKGKRDPVTIVTIETKGVAA